MFSRQKTVALACFIALVIAPVLTFVGCNRPAANTAKPPLQDEQPTETKPVTPDPAPHNALVVMAQDLGGNRGGSRSVRLDQPHEVYETWSELVSLNLHGDLSFNQEDLSARIKVEPSTDYCVSVVQGTWATVTIPLTEEIIRVTIAAKPTAKGQPFDYDRSIEIHRVEPRTLQVTSPQYPEVHYPGEFGVPLGRTKLDFVFSHPVDRQQFEQTMNQIDPMTAYTWNDDQHVRVEFELQTESCPISFFGYEFRDSRGIPFAADVLQLRGVSERPVKLLTGPGQSKVLPSLDSLVLGAWLAPDGARLLHARSQVGIPSEGPPWGALWQMELGTGQQREVIASLAVYPPGSPAWTHGGEYWLLPGHGLGLDTKAHLYGGQGSEPRTISTVVAQDDTYRLRYSAVSPTGDTIAYLVLDLGQISQGPFAAELSPNDLYVVSSIDGSQIRELPQIVWSQNYEKTWWPRFMTYTPDGKRIITATWQPDAQGRWTPQIIEVDIASGSIIVRSDLPNPFLTDKGDLHTVNPVYARDYLLYAPTGDRYLVKSDLGLKLVDIPDYGKNSERISPPTYEIRSMAGDTLATVQVDAMQIVWAPDGKRIAFHGNGYEPFGRRLWVFDLETQQLTAWSEQEIAILAGWGPDGIVVIEDAPAR